MTRWGFALFLILLLPVFGLFRLAFAQNPSFDLHDLWIPVFHTFLLSLGSGVLVVGLSFFGALALASRSSRHPFHLLTLLPSMIPQLLLLIAVLSTWSPFPYGWVGAFVGITVATSGIVTVGLANSIRGQCGGLAEAALVLGAKRGTFVRRILIPAIGAELTQSFYLVFGFVFSTFAIPLVLGAGQIRTLEFEAYRHAFQNFDYWVVLALGLLQFVVIFTLGTRVSALRFESGKMLHGLGLLRSPTLDLFLLFVPVLILFGLGRSFWDVLVRPLNLTGDLLLPALGTLGLSFSVGLSVVCLFWLFVMAIPADRQVRILMGLQSPSTVLIALGIWGIFAIPISQQSLEMEFLFITLSVGLSSFCVVIKMGWVARWGLVRGQMEAARILGASDKLISTRIIWPQMRGLAWSLGGWTALWAAGDFTFSTLLSSRDWTLGLIAESFLGFYRIREAFVVTWLALLIGALVLIGFQRRGRVLDPWN